MAIEVTPIGSARPRVCPPSDLDRALILRYLEFGHPKEPVDPVKRPLRQEG